MSKVLIDKSGDSKKKDKIRSRIEKIHLTEEPTVQEFLQPIEPNLRRTPAVQLKQMPFVPLAARAEDEKKILEAVRLSLVSIKDAPKKDKSEIRKLLQQLPSAADIRLLKATTSADPLAMLEALISKERELSLKDKAQDQKQEKQSAKSLKDLEELRKAAAKRSAEAKAQEKIIDQKGRAKKII